MNLKVSLPDPFELKPEHFFAQMRIALKAAEKTYQEAIKGLTEEEIEDIWLSFELTGLETTKKNREILEEIDPDYNLRQGISIIIGRS